VTALAKSTANKFAGLSILPGDENSVKRCVLRSSAFGETRPDTCPRRKCQNMAMGCTFWTSENKIARRAANYVSPNAFFRQRSYEVGDLGYHQCTSTANSWASLSRSARSSLTGIGPFPALHPGSIATIRWQVQVVPHPCWDFKFKLPTRKFKFCQ
jgi:hypothetical protein